MLKTYPFAATDFQEVVETRHRHALEDCASFYGEWDLLPTPSVLELACGRSTGSGPIIDFLEPGNYVGTDIRSSALDPSWSALVPGGLSADNTRLICSPTFSAAEIGPRPRHSESMKC
jgi:hypothetical protein